MNSTVSIIIPIYNVEKYLRECVNSVLNQTYAEIEAILVDDGSTDDSGRICDEFASKDSRVKVIHKENGGLSDARNAGMNLAQGDYLYFLDSDDYIRLDAIKRSLEVIESDNADIVCFDAETIYEDFNDSGYREEFSRKQSYDAANGSKMLELQLKNNEYFSLVPLQLYNRSFLEKNKLRFKKDMMHEDELFTAIAFVRAKRISCINAQLYFRRLRANSIMSEKATKKSVSGLACCIEGIVEEINYYPRSSTTYSALRKLVQNKLYEMYWKYYKLDKIDRQTLRVRINEIKKVLANSSYLGSVKLFIKVNFSGLVNVYNRLKIREEN